MPPALLALVVRRARAQRRLLLGVVVLVTAGATLLGVGSLLLTVTQERALEAQVHRLPADDLAATAYLVEVRSSDAVAVREEARRVLRSALRPLGSRTSAGAVSVMRRIGADPQDTRVGYLASDDALDRRARLVTGRWPRPAASGAPLEAVVPQTTARLLGLSPGRRVTLGREVAGAYVDRPVTVVVVGTFRPRSQAAFEQDPLSGAGFDPAYSDGARSAPAYGPFEVDGDALLASGSSLASIQVTAQPRLGAATGTALERTSVRLAAADPRLSASVGQQVQIERVASDLPATLARLRLQQATASSTVLVGVLLGLVLTVAALLLAARSAAVVRARELALLVGLGAGRRQLLAAAAAEGLLLGLVAAVVAVPTSSLLHAWSTHSSTLAGAGLAQGPALTAPLVLTVLAGAALLASVLVLPALRPEPSTGSGGVVARGARSGLDVLLVVLAVGSSWQLRSQPDGAPTSGDVVSVVAPVVCVAAASVVAVRLLPAVLGVLARGVRRSRPLLLPLAVLDAARRPPSATASVLLVAAVASATFGLALSATWRHSQAEQASLRVGTDLAVGLTAPPTAAEAAEVARAGGGATSAVTTRPVALGRFVGDTGSVPTLVAIDARRAGELLRGRPPAGRSWASVGRSLAPGRRVVGPSVSSGTTTLEGTVVTRELGTVLATPTLVLQGEQGLRTTLVGGAVPLDGRPHPVSWSSPVPQGQRLVGVLLRLKASGDAEPRLGRSPVGVSLTVPGRASPAGPGWSVTTLGAVPGPVTAAEVDVRPGEGVTVVRTTATVTPGSLVYGDARILETAFAPPRAVPVVVSRGLVASVGTKVGRTLEVSLDGVGVPARVVSVVPAVPSAPGGIAVLADQDQLSRALLAGGRLEPAVDAWWVGDPTAGAASRVRALGLGAVVVRREVTGGLVAGPLGALVPAALLLLVVTALALALVGTGVHLAADLGSRAAETARLRALGLSRRSATGLLLGRHGVVLTVLVLIGALIGAVAALVLAPLLVRSDVGLAPLPPAVLVWPWSAELLVVLGSALLCVLLAAVLATRQVRRSGTASSLLEGS